MRAAAAPETDAPALPPLFRHHVRRPRLTRLLDASTARLIVLTAPAGYGKTTLAAEWLQGRPEEEVAWYYASPASADVAALSVGIAEAVSHILPAGDRVRQRLRVPEVPDNNAEILAELLAHDLKAWPANAWLVLDDYHHAMESKSAERFVEELLRLAPIQVLITSRRRPSWVTARRVVYGEVVELTRDQLMMTDEEAEAVLGQRASGRTHGSVLTESWPALVGLAVLAHATRRAESGLGDDVFRYFADEVLRSEEPETQEFLLVAAVPPFLTTAIRAMLPVELHSTALRDLTEKGLLRSDGHDRHSFHPLLRTFLRSQLKDANPALFASVGNEILHHFLSTSQWDAALATATELREPESIATAFARAGCALLQDGRLDTLELFSSAIPATLHRRPEVALIRAEIALRRGQYHECAALSLNVATLANEETTFRARALILYGRACHLLSEHSKALDAYDQAGRIVEDDETRFEIAWGQFIVASEIPLDDLSRRLAKLERLPAPDPNRRLRISAGKALINAHAGRGDASHRAVRECLALLALADDPMAISHVLALAAAISVASADYAEAEQRAVAAIAYCTSLRLDFAHAYCVAYRAGAEIGLRRLEDARASLREIDHRSRLTEDSHLWLLRSILTLKLRIAEGGHELAVRFCPSAELTELERLPAAQAGELFALEAIVHAANGDSSAFSSKRRLALELTTDRTPRVCADLASIVYDLRMNGSTDDLSTRLGEVVDEANRSGQLDAFVSAYRACPQLFLALPRDVRSISLARRAILEGRDEALVTRLEGRGAAILLPQEARLALTSREAEVASLIAQGLSNREIARRLYIAPSTAKVHVRHILRKLGVNTRLEAALRWREFLERV